jgi:hypothetical protein
VQVLVCAVAVVLGLYGLDRGVTSVLPVGTPAEQAQVLSLLDSLAVPAGMTRDPYATACGGGTRYCVSKAGGSRSHVAMSVVELLTERGARKLNSECHEDEELYLGCVDRLVLDGVGVYVLSGDRAGSGAVPAPAYAAVKLAGEGFSPYPVGKPLPSLTLLGLTPVPAASARCLEPKGAGCMRYRGSGTAVGSARETASQWRNLLVRLGYRVDSDHCEAQPTGQLCRVAGQRFRTFGGQDPVLVVLSTSDNAVGTATVTLFVSTDGAHY